jgi:4-amino-4-deoxy-L-arabinose transferase-like glycosyltransferase
MSSSKIYPAFWAAVVLLYLCAAFFIDLIDVDAAQYASIAREMTESSNWLIVKHKYADYLDKPPLLFWLSSLSYKIFGIGHFAYRLPSILATFLGLYATYALGRKLYDKKTGQMAALILATSQAWILFNHDIRTDTLLAAFSITAIWQLVEYSDCRKWYNFLFGFICIGLAMLAKGPLGAVIPGIALSVYWLGQKQWKNLFRPEWLLGILIVFAVLSPMLIGLWLQWKWDGIYFYFWKQSFGRITGENSWRNDSGAFFFVHSFLWSFLPWALIAVWAFAKRAYQYWAKGADRELLTLSGFLIPFIVLSFSTYKLPHYIFPLYPFIAIIAAVELRAMLEKDNRVLKVFTGIQFVMTLLIFTLAILFCSWFFPTKNLLVWGIIIVSAILLIFLLFNKSDRKDFIINGSIISVLMINFVLSLHLYPQLLKYQSGSQAAAFINKNAIDVEELAVYRLYPNSLDFYTQSIAQIFESPDKLINALSNQALWIFTDEIGKKQLEEYGAIIENIKTFDHFHISKLSLKFLHPKTRAGVTGKAYLLRVSGVVS